MTYSLSPLIAALLLILLLGAAVRLPLLGSSEFQGDESRAILMAASVRDGQDEVLLLRPKGPVEVLLPAGMLTLTGQMTEGAARLPFALAGVGLLLGVYLLARRMLHDEGARLPLSGAAVGLLAAALLALDGFMVAFARIVQYQSVILVLMTGALWCGWRFYQGAPHPQRYLLSAAVLAAVAMLAHYDGAFVLPALGWLTLAGGWRRGWRDAAAWVRGLAPPLLAGAGLLLAFYLPFVLNEHFSATTADYLAYRLREGDSTSLSFNNLVGYYELASFYSPAFQVAALALALLGGVLAWLLRYGRAVGWALGALLLLGSALLLLRPAAFALPGGQNWALLAFGLPLLGLALLSAVPAALRVLLLWFAAPFVAMAFVIAEPRTHFYAMHPAAALLISLALLELARWLTQRRLHWARRALAGTGALLALLALPYLYMAFIRPQPEFLRDFPASRPALYTASYGDSLPTDAGYFAFPQRDGWKVAGELFRRDILRGDYDSNKKPLITNWYMRGVYRCAAEPDYFLLARAESYLLPEGYDLYGVILVDERRMMDIYSRAPIPSRIPQVFELADYRAAFEARQVASFPTQRFLFDVVPQYHLRATWEGGLQLRGYDLFGPPLAPGDTPIISLYWQSAQPLAAGAEPVLELLNAQGEPVSRAVPHCGDGAAAAWRAGAGRISDTAFRLPLPADLPPGTYHLRLGIRAAGGAWLPLEGGAPRLAFGMLRVQPTE
jgi:4-amino-4-deoxy-L-arabinose transferase-like glycosyltransferase